jgi:hypothetical protein
MSRYPRRIILKGLLALLAVIPMSLASTSTYYLDVSRMELQVAPATDTASGMVKVSSNSDHKIRLRVIPKLWTLNAQGVLSYTEPAADDPANLLNTIDINPEEFDLLPGKSRLVRFLVKVPDQPEDAEYPFQLYFQPMDQLNPPAATPGAAVSNVLDVVPVFTTTVYVYKGNPRPDVKVDSFQCGYQPDTGTFPISLALENQGAKHARLFGNIILSPKTTSGLGQPLDVLHLQNSTLIIVFPGTPRLVQNQLVSDKIKTLPAGNYRLELQLVDERNVQPAVQATCDLSVPAS